MSDTHHDEAREHFLPIKRRVASEAIEKQRMINAYKELTGFLFLTPT
jgi:hypothetical protein